MKNKQLLLEHSNMMFHSRELVQLHVPAEINFMMYSISILFVVIGIGMVTIQINDVKKVSGIVKTQENISTVKNVIPGKIEQIYYKPDQYVHKGEILYSLNKEVYNEIVVKLEMNIEDIKKELKSINLLLDGFYNSKNNFSDKTDLKGYSQMEEYLKTISYLEEELGIYEYKYQMEKNLPEVFFNKMNLDEAWMNLCLHQKELEKYKAEFLAKLSEIKENYEFELQKLTQDLIKTKKEYVFLEIESPKDGFVQEISSLNVGDYIFADQSVINVVPSQNNNFRVEMAVGPKDIGEIVPGMAVKYRISAFPFFEYKGAQGIIISIDPNIRQNSDGRLFYQVYADIDRISFMNKKGEEYPIRAGLEIDARIVLEKINIMHFILRKLDFMQ